MSSSVLTVVFLQMARKLLIQIIMRKIRYIRISCFTLYFNWNSCKIGFPYKYLLWVLKMIRLLSLQTRSNIWEDNFLYILTFKRTSRDAINPKFVAWPKTTLLQYWRSLNFTTIESTITFGKSMCHENLFAYLPILLYWTSPTRYHLLQICLVCDIKFYCSNV